MKAPSGKFRSGPSARRLIGLLVAVIWTATALQPCLMASVPGSTPVHANHTDSIHEATREFANPDCAHCPPARDASEPCADPLDGACASDDQAPWLTQTKPLDAEKFYRLPNPPVFAQSPAPVAHRPDLAYARHWYPPPWAPGPALIDLYRSYLK